MAKMISNLQREGLSFVVDLGNGLYGNNVDSVNGLHGNNVDSVKLFLASFQLHHD